MSRRSRVLLSLVLGSLLAAAAPPPRAAETTAGADAALVVLGPPFPAPAEIAAARAELESGHRVATSPELRRLLEGSDRAPAPESRVREALAQASERRRRFDFHAADRALEAAIEASGALRPTPGATALLVDLWVEVALVASLENDAPRARDAMALALSASPALELDPLKTPPTLVTLLRETRSRLRQASGAPLRVISSPPGAAVLIAGQVVGRTPLQLPSAPASPTLIILALDGCFPRVLPIRDSREVSLELRPLDLEQRLGPMVDALRASSARDRPSRARDLAGSLEFEAIGVLAPGAALEIHRRTIEASQPLPAASPWYEDWLTEVLTGGGLVAVGVGAVFLGVGEGDAASAQRAETFGDLELRADSASRDRTAGGVLMVAGTVLFTGGILQWALRE